MTIRESVKKEIDTLPEEAVYAVRDFVLFQKYRGILEIDDSTYLNMILRWTHLSRHKIVVF